MLYPMRHDRVISAEATKYKVDPSLVRAIIRQESAFVEDARSSANARGLMQVLPSTGRSLARGAGIGRYTVQKLFRPEVNIALGTRFLSGLLNEYDYKLEVALAAYNAGTDRADTWTREYSFSDMAEFVERIPFAETRDYVKQVLTNASYYRLVAAATNAGSR
jgi:soluble lytic murein transglycosylase